MKNVLVVLTQGENSGLTSNEMVQALMLFASFGTQISVLFENTALNLLNHSQRMPQPPSQDSQLPLFKSVRDMVASFEFYDIENMFIHEQDHNLSILKNSPYDLTPIVFNRDFIAQFDHVIYG